MNEEHIRLRLTTKQPIRQRRAMAKYLFQHFDITKDEALTICCLSAFDDACTSSKVGYVECFSKEHRKDMLQEIELIKQHNNLKPRAEEKPKKQQKPYLRRVGLYETPHTVGAYVLEFKDANNKTVFTKIGSSSDIHKRCYKITDGEYLKRLGGKKVTSCHLVHCFKTSDRYGAYTIENMLHTHFLKQGYIIDGNDYFLNASTTVEDLNNDFPLRLMSILLSPDIDHKPLYASIKRLLTLMKYI